MICLYSFKIDWYQASLPALNDWLRSEVVRLNLPSLRVVSHFDVTLEMLEADGVHLKPSAGDLFLQQLCQSTQIAVSLPPTAPTDAPGADNPDIVDIADTEAASADDDDDEVQALPSDRLGAILRIVTSNSRRLAGVKPLRDALEKLDERSSAFETQVRLRRQRDNLVFARIKEESDCELNRTRENRVVVSGLPRASSTHSTHAEKKAYYSQLISDLIAKSCPQVDPLPVVTEVIVNLQRNQASPSVEAKIDSSAGALAFRKSASSLAKAQNPDFANLYFSNSVTQATRVRIEILKAIAKRLTTETETAHVQGFLSRPVLHYNVAEDAASVASGTGRSYSFIDAVTRFGDLLQDVDLTAAYKRAGGTFRGAMEQYFVVLREVEDVSVSPAAGSNVVPLGSRGRIVRGSTPLRKFFRGGRGRKRLGVSSPETPSKRRPNM